MLAIEKSTDLKTWQPFLTITLDNTGSFNLDDVLPLDQQRAFYRARQASGIATFSDNFNRADSSSVGNGWINCVGNVGGNLVIANNELTCPNVDGNAGLYRPLSLTSPARVTATLKEMNGFGSLQRRYTWALAFMNNGSLNQGYILSFSRADQNYSDSKGSLYDSATLVGAINSTFQYGAQIQVDFTVHPDGSVNGTVNGDGNTFPFSFPPRAIQSTGSNFAIWDSLIAQPLKPRLDDLTIQPGQ